MSPTPAERSMASALLRLIATEPNRQQLRRFVGPPAEPDLPLRLAKLLKALDEAQVDRRPGGRRHR